MQVLDVSKASTASICVPTNRCPNCNYQNVNVCGQWSVDRLSTESLRLNGYLLHFNGVKMGAMASQITSLTIVYSIAYSGDDQRKHQRSASLAFVRVINR